MVGPCFAALAARDPHVGGLRVALVEPATPAPPRAGEVDLRVSALSRASQRILDAVEAWEPIEPQACAYSEMVVWDAASRPDAPDALRFSAAETGEPDLGHIVENLRVQWALSESPLLRRMTRLHTALAELEPRRGRRAAHARRRPSAARGAGGGGRRRRIADTRARRHRARRPAVSRRRRWSRTSRPSGRTRRRRGSGSCPVVRSRSCPCGTGVSRSCGRRHPPKQSRSSGFPRRNFPRASPRPAAGCSATLTLASGRARFPLALWHAREYCRPQARARG